MLPQWKELLGLDQNTNYWCAIAGCPNIAEVGAHVRKVDPNDQKVYIAGTCQHHNKQPNDVEMELRSTSYLVPLTDFDK